MNVLLIDADSTIPNVALMKLSTWHKGCGDSVDFTRLNIPYYPSKKKKLCSIDTSIYDKVYCSVVFEGVVDFVRGDNIIFGGTGYDLETVLPTEVEESDCDYSLYPDNTVSYGFLTRGCIRRCKFCVVSRKEGYIRKVNDVDDVVRHSKAVFLDNNILAYPKHMEVFLELTNKKIKCQFKQGLDIRLVTPWNSIALSKLNYMGDYIFAFDDIRYQYLVKKKLALMKWRSDWQFKFFVYAHPRMLLANVIERVELLRSWKCLPYLMRDISCWDSAYSDFYVDLAAYCNQPGIFKGMNFDVFMQKRTNNVERQESSWSLYKENLK